MRDIQHKFAEPSILGHIASSDVASNICQDYCPSLHPTQVLNPRFLSHMASYDVASNICQAHCPSGTLVHDEKASG